MTSRSALDLRLLVEATVAIVVTWLLLGWTFDRAFTGGDATIFGVPYTQSALRAGFDWTDHLYRFGVVGGAPMHDLAGMLPLVQVCSVLGLSATATANLTTIFVQLCFAFFGIKAAEGLATIWTGEPRTPTATERITAVWLLAFAPVLGWRIAAGHENLLFGLIPFLVGISLVFSARAQRLSTAALAFGALAVFHGLSSFGSQLLIYSAIFGLPIALVAVLATGGKPRWTWGHTAAVCVIVAGVLFAVPRALGMIQYAIGDDAARSIGHAVTYSFGAAKPIDWLHSVPWTTAGQNLAGLHERNFPFGPVLLLAIGLWPKQAGKRLWWGLAASALLAVLFADNVSPFSDALLAAISPLRPFRVPARAILPVLVILPSLALAAIWTVKTRTPAGPRDRQIAWLGCLAGALVIALGHGHLAIAREACVWIGCLAVVLLLRRGRIDNPALGAVIAVIAGLGVAAFDERFPSYARVERIEEGPRALREAVLASAPELAMPLNRVQIVDAQPYDVGTAFAAQLSSLDGDFNPPRRFLDLLGALRGKPLPSTSVVFRLTRSSMFPVLQQLYNVRHVVRAGGEGSIQTLPETAGPAWFPERIEVIDDAAAMQAALRSTENLQRLIASTAWLLRADLARAPALPLQCANAKVGSVATDEIGQSAVIDVALATPCVLVVPTTYVTMLHATAVVGQVARDVPVFPIDVALTGIAVPANATSVTLAPRRVIPWWTRLAQVVGFALLVAAVARYRRQG